MVNNIKYPPKLEKGDKIGLVAPAGIIKAEYVESAKKFFQSKGFDVIEGKHLYKNKGVFSADDRLRLEDINSMIRNNEIKAIVAVRGGYGSARIIDKVDFNFLEKHPKWLVGFSDITVFHLALSKYKIASLHATMPVNFETTHPESLSSLTKALQNKKNIYTVEKTKFCRNGQAEAILTGGNLSIIYSLNSTKYEVNTDGKILFIEDLSEYLYHLDRMMLNLKLSGKLENLAGIIVGGMNDMKDGASKYGKSAYEIIYEHIKDYDYPAIFGFPAGHIHKNLCLTMNTKVKILVNNTKSTIEF